VTAIDCFCACEYETETEYCMCIRRIDVDRWGGPRRACRDCESGKHLLDEKVNNPSLFN
jgi:hypothetical protein